MDTSEKQIKRRVDSESEEDPSSKQVKCSKDKDDDFWNINSRIIKSIKSKNIEETRTIWMDIKDKKIRIKPNWISFILHACLTSNETDLACNVIDTANSIHIQIPEASYSALILLFCNSNQLSKAFDYLSIMYEHSVIPRIRTFTPFLDYCQRNANTEILDKILIDIKKYDLYNDIEIFSYILNTYTNKGDKMKFMETLSNMNTMFDLGCDSIQKSLALFCTKYPEYSLIECSMNDEGICQHCNEKLCKREITQNERKPLYMCLERIIRERDKHNTIFDNLLEYTKTHHFKIVLDGANIAHYKQNFIGGDFNFEQIYITIDLLMKEYAYKEEDICIFLHEKHFSDDNVHLNELISKGMVYKVNRGENDDWFWMYYALYNNIYLLSNDQMRDHFFRMSFPREFKHFREGNQINYDIVFYDDKKHIKLIFPKIYSTCFHLENPDHMHIPIGKKIDKDGKEYVFDKWLCFEHKNE